MVWMLFNWLGRVQLLLPVLWVCRKRLLIRMLLTLVSLRNSCWGKDWTSASSLNKWVLYVHCTLCISSSPRQFLLVIQLVFGPFHHSESVLNVIPERSWWLKLYCWNYSAIDTQLLKTFSAFTATCRILLLDISCSFVCALSLGCFFLFCGNHFQHAVCHYFK